MFKTIESDVTKTGTAISIFGKEVNKVYSDFASAINGIKTKKGDKSQFSIGRIFGNKLSQQDIDAISKYNAGLKNMTDEQGNAISLNSWFYECLANSSAKAQELARNMHGAAVSEEALSVATKTSTVALKAQQVAMRLAANVGFMVIISLISEGVKRLSDFINHIEITTEKVSELMSTFDSALESANSNAKRIEEIADRYEELSKGVNNLGENVSLTNDEYEEYTSLHRLIEN